MKMQAKLFLSSGIAVLLMLLILINHVDNIDRYKQLIRGDQNSELIARIYSEKNNYRLLVQEKIWEAISFPNNRDNYIEGVKQKLAAFLVKYKDSKSQEDKLSLPKEIKQSIVILNSKIDAYVISVQEVITFLGKGDLSKELHNLEKQSNEINMDYILLNDQLTKVIEEANLKRDEWFNGVSKRPLFIISLMITIIIIISLFINFSILRPLSQIIKIMNLIISGNRVEEASFINREDEIGEIAKALEVFILTGVEKEKLEEQAKQQATKSEEDRHNSMLAFSHQFENSVKSIVDTVALSVRKMDEAALELEQLSAITQEETSLLSSISVKSSTSMQGVSKASSEFSAEVNEITIQVNNSLGYASKVVERADQVNSMVVDLETKANAVSSIIDIINGITSQIDLLALNATIEAARAGDMGKGFAVVANEVKALATQTSKATEQINIQVSGIQSSTNKAVISIQEITESVKTINHNSASIVSSVEKQNKASSYIADSISEVSNMSNSVTSGVEKVADSSSRTGKSSSEIALSAKGLLKQSKMLQDEVDKFLSSLKFT